MNSISKKEFNGYLKENDFSSLFNEMGWENPEGNTAIAPIEVNDTEYHFEVTADKSGYKIICCPTRTMPTASACRQIVPKLRKSAHYFICIFYNPDTLHHLWITTVKSNGKRDLVTIEYNSAENTDFLFTKAAALTFDLEQKTNITDITAQIDNAFRVNAEGITKDFYNGFSKEHKAFAKFITGIDDHITNTDENRNKQWYTSVMLNRLMFCYFIQKKGFLNNDIDYLRNKLTWVKEQKQNQTFFTSFYKGFLTILFQGGLNSPLRDDDFKKTYGKIPYLNGGMFDQHQIERDYQGIDIADEAFEHLFNFFDKWRWHLDTRITASGKDINPDVLGYIFEQYINDRAAMGAYYTKEDITEYISKNCILPFLIDKTQEKLPKAFKPDGEVWQLLRNSHGRYIYNAVKKGHTPDWQQRIPDYIAQGIDTAAPNLLQRRDRWNEKTHEQFALPTEIWRETIERLQRCDALLRKISDGEITSINHFITYNLDIRQFAEDMLRTTQDHKLIEHFYKALQNVSILDPTCGSGAFLFAALNILEPLYEACIDRMEDFHRQNPNLFSQQLAEITSQYRSNRQYFIYKSIILRNLYGVDIMAEATEIAKLRLFLKLVAVVEADKRKENLGLDPLPDIDFNIKCGNTLVGYATEEEINDAFYDDLFSNEIRDEIEAEMSLVAKAYDLFRSEQLRTYDDNASLKHTKQQLKEKLSTLNNLLNRKMYDSETVSTTDYNEWLASHQPFHWLAEFYQIIKGNGGFDVIIGNPPYVEYNKKDSTTKKAVSDYYKLTNYTTLSCGNLYAFVTERCLHISYAKTIGLIIPTSSLSTSRMEPLQKIVKQFGVYHSTYGFRPAKLFDGGTSANLHLSIVLISKKIKNIFALHHIKWNAEYRNYLFHTLPPYTENTLDIVSKYNKILRSKSNCEKTILDKIYSKKTIQNYFVNSEHKVYYRTTGGLHYRVFTIYPTYSKKESSLSFANASSRNCVFALLASNLWNMFYYATSNCLDVAKFDIYNFPINLDAINLENKSQLNQLASALNDDIKSNSKHTSRCYENVGDVEIYQINMRASKPIIDEIDKVLAKHYGFTDEELDFIINYDIKYRMGDELGGED